MHGTLQRSTLSVLFWMFSLSSVQLQAQDFGIAEGRNATITYTFEDVSVFSLTLRKDGIVVASFFSDVGNPEITNETKYFVDIDLDNAVSTVVVIDSIPSDVGIYTLEVEDVDGNTVPIYININYFVTDSEIGEIHTLLCGDTYQDVGSHTLTTPCSTVNVVMPTGYNHSFTVEFSMDNGVTETQNDTDCDGSDPCMLSFSLPGDYILVHGSTFNVSVDLLLLSDPPVISTFQFTYEDWGPWQGKCPRCGGCGTQRRSATTSDGSVVYDTRQCPAKRCVNRMHSRREWVKPRRRWIIRARMCCYTWRWSPRNPSPVSIRDCRQRRVRGWVNPPWTD